MLRPKRSLHWSAGSCEHDPKRAGKEINKGRSTICNGKVDCPGCGVVFKCVQQEGTFVYTLFRLYAEHKRALLS